MDNENKNQYRPEIEKTENGKGGVAKAFGAFVLALIFAVITVVVINL